MNFLKKYGLQRGIERHNFLIKSILENHVKSLKFNGDVLDLGCGSMPYADIIIENGASNYTGVDWNATNRNLKYKKIEADISKTLPFPNEYTNTIVSFEVLEHLPEPDLFINECWRILKNDGELFLTVPFIWHVHEDPYDYYRFTKYGLEYLLKKNNFTDIEVEELAGFWISWALIFNYHTVSYSKGPIKYFLYLVWWVTQNVSVFLDRVNYNSRSTCNYKVYAKKGN